MKKILVIAVHPDDETLGCGGTLLRSQKEGNEIYWLTLTGMHKSQGFSQDKIEERSKEIGKVEKLYSFKKSFHLGFPTAKLDEFSSGEIISAISKVFNEVKPEIIYLPFKGDVHSDHRIAFDAAYSCTKSFRYPSIKNIYMMETLSETEFAPSIQADSFIPNVFVDISNFLEKKLDIMRVFRSELGVHPFPRSEKNIKALATIRGATAGVEYAESFMLLKEIQ